MSRPDLSIIAYERGHIDLLAVQEAQRGEAERFCQVPGALAELGPAFTAVELGPNASVARILCCAGLAENVPVGDEGGGYATAWASFAEGLRPAEWSFVTAAIRGVLERCRYARVDMVVTAGFDRAHRYANALGFSIDSMIYARRGGAAGGAD